MMSGEAFVLILIHTFDRLTGTCGPREILLEPSLTGLIQLIIIILDT